MCPQSAHGPPQPGFAASVMLAIRLAIRTCREGNRRPFELTNVVTNAEKPHPNLEARDTLPYASSRTRCALSSL